MTLVKFLSNFNGSSSEAELQKMFKNLAPVFLYGGYIQVRNEYRIYIRTVEFYFHSEKHDGVHDPIVYHRDGRDLERAPYFPPMTLHAHKSGYDITFESESGRYRASALIRSYEVKTRDGKYLKWDTKKGMFIETEKYGYKSGRADPERICTRRNTPRLSFPLQKQDYKRTERYRHSDGGKNTFRESDNCRACAEAGERSLCLSRRPDITDVRRKQASSQGRSTLFYRSP